MKKNRALRAIDFLKEAPNKTLRRDELDRLLHTNYSPRAISEAIKLGYSINEINLKTSFGVIGQYTLNDNWILEAEKKPEYQFDPIKQVYIYS